MTDRRATLSASSLSRLESIAEIFGCWVRGAPEGGGTTASMVDSTTGAPDAKDEPVEAGRRAAEAWPREEDFFFRGIDTSVALKDAVEVIERSWAVERGGSE